MVQSSQPPTILTIVDALKLAKKIQRYSMVDKGRFARAYDLAEEALKGFGQYEIMPIGKVLATRRCHYAVQKFDDKGNKEAQYLVNLSSNSGCNCPDVTQNNIINCKHVIGVILWQAAHDIFNQQVKDN